MDRQDERRLAQLELERATAKEAAALASRSNLADVALNERLGRVVAEDAAVNANIRAGQAEARERSMATSASLSRQDARSERDAASNASFTATLVAVLAIGVVIAAVGYFAWWQPNHPASTNTTVIRTDKTVEKPGPVPSVYVTPPDVNVKVNVPPADPPIIVPVPVPDPLPQTDPPKLPGEDDTSPGDGKAPGSGGP